MGAFGYVDVPGAIVDLAVDASTVNPGVSASFQNEHTLVITPAPDEYVEVQRIEEAVGLDKTATGSGVSLQAGASFQNEGSAEGVATQFASRSYGTGTALDATNGDLQTVGGDLAHTGRLGKSVTVRTKLRVSAVTGVTAVESANGKARGRKVKRLQDLFGGAFVRAF